ncbi:MAG: oxalate/formate MFS antiporter [Betaproteobacteria bacterium]|nr:oxalate/formate MFS antiporter [Betaproteobacteria bacterium]
MATQERYPNRWVQLILGIVCMATVANLQYGWTLFVAPMQDKHHWARTSIQLAFTIFIFFETWLVPVEGWLVDKYGPRPVIFGGAILAAIGWVMNSMATTLGVLYAAAVISGMGAGAVYGTAVGNALKWFPDKRGLAAGATAAGFGGGAALTVVPVAAMINSSGYEAAFLWFGIGQGIVIAICSIFMPRAKLPPGTKAIPRVVSSKKEFTPTQIMRQPIFWLIYVCFVGVASGGIMATASFGPVSRDYGISRIPVTLMGVTLPLLTMAMSIDNICNGATRPFCGWLSDRFGRENVMFLVFMGEGFALLGLMAYGRSPFGFMLFAALTFAFWGEIFSLFPSMCADTFGVKNAAGNAGTLYTAKGTSSLLVPFAAGLSAGGNWDRVFILSAVIAFVCSFLSFFVLKPWRRRFILANNAEIEAAAAKAGTAAA